MRFCVALCVLLSACSTPTPQPVLAEEARWAATSELPNLAEGYPERLPTAVPLDWAAFPKVLNKDKAPDGRVIYVDSDATGPKMDGSVNRPFKTIRAALARSRRGDRISVKAGTYPEGEDGGFISLEISKGRGGITLVSEGGRAIVTPATPGHTYGLDIGADDVTVMGFDFVGFGNSGVVLGNQGHTSRNLVLAHVDVIYEGKELPTGIAMLPDNGGEPVVDGVLLSNVRVKGASIGVQCNVGPCRNLRFEGLRIEGAKAGSNSGFDGLAVESGDNILILDTEVTGSSADGIDIKATRVAIFNSFVHHVDRNGIKLWFGGDIVNTVVSHTGADVSVSLGTGDYRIIHSVIAYHNWNGSTSYSLVAAFKDRTPTSVAILNSVFYRNSGGMYFGPTTKVRIEGSLFRDIENNTLARGGEGESAFDLWTTDRDVRSLEALGLGSDNLSPGVDPRFRDPDKADYRVRPGSPLIDAGRTVPTIPRFDLAWQHRTSGGTPDIGPFEVQR